MIALRLPAKPSISISIAFSSSCRGSNSTSRFFPHCVVGGGGLAFLLGGFGLRLKLGCRGLSLLTRPFFGLLLGLGLLFGLGFGFGLKAGLFLGFLFGLLFSFEFGFFLVRQGVFAVPRTILYRLD